MRPGPVVSHNTLLVALDVLRVELRAVSHPTKPNTSVALRPCRKGLEVGPASTVVRRRGTTIARFIRDLGDGRPQALSKGERYGEAFHA